MVLFPHLIKISTADRKYWPLKSFMSAIKVLVFWDHEKAGIKRKKYYADFLWQKSKHHKISQKMEHKNL